MPRLPVIFYVEFRGSDMTLIEADGVAVVEKTVKRLKLATAETYDVLVEIPASKQYELRATSEDGTGYASYYLGAGETVPVPPMAKPNLHLVGHGNHSPGRNKMMHADRHGDMHRKGEYAGLRAKRPTSFDKKRNTRENRSEIDRKHGKVYLVIRR